MWLLEKWLSTNTFQHVSRKELLPLWGCDAAAETAAGSKAALLASKCAHIHSGEGLQQRQKADLYVGAGTRLYPLSSLWFHSDSHKQMFPFIGALTELESCESKASALSEHLFRTRFKFSTLQVSSELICRRVCDKPQNDNFLIFFFIFQVKQQSDNKQAEKVPK